MSSFGNLSSRKCKRISPVHPQKQRGRRVKWWKIISKVSDDSRECKSNDNEDNDSSSSQHSTEVERLLGRIDLSSLERVDVNLRQAKDVSHYDVKEVRLLNDQVLVTPWNQVETRLPCDTTAESESEESFSPKSKRRNSYRMRRSNTILFHETNLYSDASLEPYETNTPEAKPEKNVKNELVKDILFPRSNFRLDQRENSTKKNRSKTEPQNIHESSKKSNQKRASSICNDNKSDNNIITIKNPAAFCDKNQKKKLCGRKKYISETDSAEDDEHVTVYEAQAKRRTKNCEINKDEGRIKPKYGTKKPITGSNFGTRKEIRHLDHYSYYQSYNRKPATYSSLWSTNGQENMNLQPQTVSGAEYLNNCNNYSQEQNEDLGYAETQESDLLKKELLENTYDFLQKNNIRSFSSNKKKDRKLKDVLKDYNTKTFQPLLTNHDNYGSISVVGSVENSFRPQNNGNCDIMQIENSASRPYYSSYNLSQNTQPNEFYVNTSNNISWISGNNTSKSYQSPAACYNTFPTEDVFPSTAQNYISQPSPTEPEENNFQMSVSQPFPLQYRSLKPSKSQYEMSVSQYRAILPSEMKYRQPCSKTFPSTHNQIIPSESNYPNTSSKLTKSNFQIPICPTYSLQYRPMIPTDSQYELLACKACISQYRPMSPPEAKYRQPACKSCSSNNNQTIPAENNCQKTAGKVSKSNIQIPICQTYPSQYGPVIPSLSHYELPASKACNSQVRPVSPSEVKYREPGCKTSLSQHYQIMSSESKHQNPFWTGSQVTFQIPTNQPCSSQYKTMKPSKSQYELPFCNAGKSNFKPITPSFRTCPHQCNQIPPTACKYQNPNCSTYVTQHQPMCKYCSQNHQQSNGKKNNNCNCNHSKKYKANKLTTEKSYDKTKAVNMISNLLLQRNSSSLGRLLTVINKTNDKNSKNKKTNGKGRTVYIMVRKKDED